MEEKKIVFYDVKKDPFELFGLYSPRTEADMFKRLPDDVGNSVNPRVAALAKNTSGGRVRFATDSTSITVKAKLGKIVNMFHATPLMENGFDIYTDGSDVSRFSGSFRFDHASAEEYQSTVTLPAGMKELTINFPLYGEVHSLEIGLDEGAQVKAHTAYKRNIPIVYYGSSITQGGCATRPGLSYQSRISRKYDCDYLNLGFSGNARAEDEIVEYMSGLTMSAFVCDYDYNTPSYDHLRNTHYKMYEKIRAAHPNIPYIMISKPDFKFHTGDMVRRDIIMQSYLKARETGDNNVWFIDGASFFTLDDRGDYTVDNTHPNDVGFERMAIVIGGALREIMRW